ncbi:MAG: HAD-IIIC family phosphatase [Parasporobacterium sp.]|nr:HAD-IIIC family phosphatase [Parasporobacterium sp.]
MRQLEYPFDADLIIKKRKSLRRELLSDSGNGRIRKKIAVLGGSTTANVVQILDLFLLNQGIEAEFYESEYNKYYEDAVYGTEELSSFLPDLVFIHTGIHNVQAFPLPGESAEQVEEKLEAEFSRFRTMWEKLTERFGCVIIQNNFEMPDVRLFGNKDSVEISGGVSFINRLNARFSDYAREHTGFYIHDVHYLSSYLGLSKWCDPFYWNMYKYCPAVPLIPELSYSVSLIIKSLYGKNKKVVVLDMDNTLWGGIVGDDGPENLEIGQESARGETFYAFQKYLKTLKERGVLLAVDSKNEYENAIAGLSVPGSALSPDDFLSIKANWQPKDRNIREIAEELNLGADSFVFVDDNPAERLIVAEQIEGIAVPEIAEPESYIRILDRSGFFEATEVSKDDAARNEMYKANAQRAKLKETFADYREYLQSLSMKAEIAAFAKEYIPRIAQLTGKSNQFNLTTLRLSASEIEEMAASENWITLYGKLEDRFGDNGVVAVEAAEILPEEGNEEEKTAHIRLNLMSCRVLKRDMEFAMLDELVRKAKEKGIKTIVGYYYPTKKNGMVKELYTELGFLKNGDVWTLDTDSYQPQCTVIAVNEPA